ncbi:MAG: FAD-dependent oxidoreductase, partial [Chitinophagia bacterium]|nr:FAD-dependent oxidoreductase [Chitinophagia bacterium]
MNKSAIVIGAGIVGLATARALAEKGFKVKVIERESFSMGASIRNFGMIWPIGQPEGVLLNRALRSREIWMDMLSQAAVWHNPCGSIHVAYNDIEWNVLQELAVTFENQGRSILLLSKEQVLQHYPAINAAHLKGGLFSSSELIINPLLSIASLPNLFKEKYQIEFLWGQ